MSVVDDCGEDANAASVRKVEPPVCSNWLGRCPAPVTTIAATANKTESNRNRRSEMNCRKDMVFQRGISVMDRFRHCVSATGCFCNWVSANEWRGGKFLAWCKLCAAARGSLAHPMSHDQSPANRQRLMVSPSCRTDSHLGKWRRLINDHGQAR